MLKDPALHETTARLISLIGIWLICVEVLSEALIVPDSLTVHCVPTSPRAAHAVVVCQKEWFLINFLFNSIEICFYV